MRPMNSSVWRDLLPLGAHDPDGRRPGGRRLGLGRDGKDGEDQGQEDKLHKLPVIHPVLRSAPCRAFSANT